MLQRTITSAAADRNRPTFIRSFRRRVAGETRHVEAERLGGLEVDHQLELDRGLDGQLARLRALEDAIGIERRAPRVIESVVSIQEAAEFRKKRNR